MRIITQPPCSTPSSKSVFEEKKKWDLNPANIYQVSVYAWNAYRENKTITSVKYDTKKGLYTVAA